MAVEGFNNDDGAASAGSFWSQLQPASWRGLPFVLLTGSARFGRRNAVHEYPFRDTPYVEDLGRGARRITVTGFIVGDDVIARRDAMIAKAEQSGDGELVHPTLGKRKVALMDFGCTEHWEQGRYFELNFSFIEQGQRQYPAGTASGQASVSNAATSTDTAASAAFAANTATALRASSQAAAEVATQTALWTSVALRSTRDATSLINLAATLPGNFGRLVGQASGLRFGEVTFAVVGLTAAGLKGLAAVKRTAVDAAGLALATAAAGITVATAAAVGAAAQALAEAVRANAATPGDALRALAPMAAFAPSRSSSGPAGIAIGETAVMVQRAAAAAMARAGARYQPASADDALLARDTVLTALDAAMDAAGDRGDDDAYQQMRTLRAAAVADLNARGASLPTLKDISTPNPQPSLVLAWRLYATIDREDDLVRRARPVHPAFMPTIFRGLSA